MNKIITTSIALALTAFSHMSYAQTNIKPQTLTQIAAQQNGRTFNDWEAELSCLYMANDVRIYIRSYAGKVPVVSANGGVLSTAAQARMATFGGNRPYIEVLRIPGSGKDGEWRQYTQGKFAAPTGNNIKASFTPGGRDTTPLPPVPGSTRPPLDTRPFYIYTEPTVTENSTHRAFSIDTPFGVRNIVLFPNGYYVSVGNNNQYIPGC